jgi:hypothetical protein
MGDLWLSISVSRGFVIRLAVFKFYQSCSSFDKIDAKSKKEIEEKILQTSFIDAWHSTKDFFLKTDNFKEIEKARKGVKSLIDLSL